MKDSSKIPDQLVAGIDLGSNSFKLMIARVKEHQGFISSSRNRHDKVDSKTSKWIE